MSAINRPSRRPLTILSALCSIALVASLSSIACSGAERSSQPDAVSTSSRVAGTAAGAQPDGSGPGQTNIHAPDLTEGEDVLAEVRKFNSDAYDAPPDTFRSGHVTPRKLDAKALSKRDDGFSVQLPNGAPITTPAVHEGVVVSSGGFHSKEIYAFAAHTGELAWAINLDDDGPSAPACEDRVCVFNTESCTVFALDSRTGEMLWSWWLGDPLTSAPTIANGLAFASYPAQGNTNIQQQAVPNAANNSFAPAQQAVQPAPPASGGVGAKVKVGSGKSKTKGRPPGQSHALAAFDLQTGELKWTRWIDSDVMSAPVAIGDALYATTFGGTIYKFDQTSGEVLAARKTRATSAPVIHGDDVWYTKRTDSGDASAPATEAIARSNAKEQSKGYIVGSKRAVYLDQTVQRRSAMAAKGKSLDASNGFGGGAPASANADAAERNVGQASVSTMQAFQGSRILHARGHNISSMGDEVICTDADTGKEKWKVKLEGDMAGAGGFLATAPAAAGSSIFVGTLSGKVLELDPASGKTLRSFEVGSPIRSQPIIDGGWIYVGTDDGKLVGFDTGDRGLGGWTQWGGNAARTGVVR
jgi:outer membrane protein assembly factor BamB